MLLIHVVFTGLLSGVKCSNSSNKMDSSLEKENCYYYYYEFLSSAEHKRRFCEIFMS